VVYLITICKLTWSVAVRFSVVSQGSSAWSNTVLYRSMPAIFLRQNPLLIDQRASADSCHVRLSTRLQEQQLHREWKDLSTPDLVDLHQITEGHDAALAEQDINLITDALASRADDDLWRLTCYSTTLSKPSWRRSSSVTVEALKCKFNLLHSRFRCCLHEIQTCLFWSFIFPHRAAGTNQQIKDRNRVHRSNHR